MMAARLLPLSYGILDNLGRSLHDEVGLGGFQLGSAAEVVVEEAEGLALGRKLGIPDGVAPLLPAQTGQRESFHGGYKGSSGGHGPKALGAHHHAIMDEMLLNPAQSNSELAQKFGMTPGYLSCIIHSDAFQLELAKRRGEIKVGILTKVSALADLVTEELLDKVPNMTVDQLLETQKNNLKSLGYGAPKMGPVGPGVNVNVTLVASEAVHAARGVLDERRRQSAALAGEVAETARLSNLGEALNGSELVTVDGPTTPPTEHPPSPTQ